MFLSCRQDRETTAAIKIQAAWRVWSVRRDISQHTKIWSAAVTIQTAWRGYRVRQWYRSVIEERRNIDPELVEKLHTAATTIQVSNNTVFLSVIFVSFTVSENFSS